MTWRAWAPDAAVGLAVLLLGLVEVLDIDPYRYPDDPRPALVAFVLGIAAAAALSRRLPAVALALVWALCVLQVLTGTQLLMIELAFGVVAFGTARWGGTATVLASALSIPVSAAIAVVWIQPSVFYDALSTAGFASLVRPSSWSDQWQLTAALLGMSVLGVPWLAGLALRFSSRARQSRSFQQAAEAERDQAEEIARLREEQAQLARDVHDVVGHSLAVILAQAESAQYLDEVDTKGLKRTMENIATSARTSLDDVRQVLASTSGAAAAPVRHADLDSLVEGVRASGHEVRSTEVGAPQPMPPELEVVAFRVLQEMLTNAIKHGRRDQPVHVERHWEGDLRIEVENAVDRASEETQPIRSVPGGQGLEGMRGRLEAVGGRLDVRRRSDPPRFTATAWIPLRRTP
ncbi:sensor histidine kinase [Nocardioides aquiterrae]|uniref:Signal transduction histidine kinase subgroup 3 dimerisation and phosphoacceptor domain-containing protein n=1 Tax=Nocardioides aquiterrae TaxID=203799 RepID=A0ABN1UQU3_9ACTN